jgi:hypothetical protein
MADWCVSGRTNIPPTSAVMANAIRLLFMDVISCLCLAITGTPLSSPWLLFFPRLRMLQLTGINPEFYPSG